MSYFTIIWPIIKVCINLWKQISNVVWFTMLFISREITILISFLVIKRCDQKPHSSQIVSMILFKFCSLSTALHTWMHSCITSCWQFINIFWARRIMQFLNMNLKTMQGFWPNSNKNNMMIVKILIYMILLHLKNLWVKDKV
jgi:hypothetical protein